MSVPTTQSAPHGRRIVVRVARQAGIVALFIVVALLGTLSGVLFAYTDDLPEISALDSYQPNTITRLFARDGQVISEFAIERRVVIGYDDIAPVLRQAIIASEDADFEQHFGLSVSRILITAVRDVLYGQRFGASTITQQVARMLFLQEYMRGGVFERSGVRGFERKIREAIVAIQLEKRYTKREIFTFYANHVTMGHGAYGIEAGAQLYFARPARNVTLEEAATIAAIVQTPARLSPFVNPDQALARRNDYVLSRMADEGFISREEAEEAAARPLVVRGQPTRDRSIAPYFAEEIRKVLEQEYGADALYEAGLRVQTTLDAGLQDAANRAIDRGLAPNRQAPERLPEAGAQCGRAGTRGRQFRGGTLGATDAYGRRRAGGCHNCPATRRRRRGYPCRAVRSGTARQCILLDAARLGGRSLRGGRPDRGGNPHGARRRT